ncbi:ABC transporter ATP-binding protein [Roseiflexus sp.]|uniref:ABC transporter ATP-binding protein n=1 Tax=Roseiflexus sp. TaxID=2562120 RepID=UPI0021DD5A48|nr:ABC transporter ATP-binding protein [Roseiflexus sp.]GIW00493.1 MAG: ABC transporter ATP-binding protein [Roseiflexus sp.]
MTSPRANAIESQDVSLIFGENTGVFDQTYIVPEGTILGLIGPSGCGKTTTVRLALGLYRPHKGTIRVLGVNPATFRAEHQARIGYIPQQFVLYPNLSVAENAEFIASLYGMRRSQIRARLDELLEFVDLTDARHRLGRQLSGGMQRRLMLVGALMHDPDLIFADEPTAGIDPVLRGKFWDYFRALRDQGRTLLITTQIVSEAMYCDYVAVMRQGRLLAIDTPQNLKRRALGGEIIHLTLANPANLAKAVGALRRYPHVKEVRYVPESDRELYVTVDDAGDWIPDVLNLLEDPNGPNIVVESAEELALTFDDVFIRIIRQWETQPIDPTPTVDDMAEKATYDQHRAGSSYASHPDDNTPRR